MFTIYDNGEMSFRSTAETLNDKKRVESLARTKMNLNSDDDKLFNEYLKRRAEDNSSNKEEALNAYKKMANLDTQEPIYHVEDIMTRDCVYINSDKKIIDAYEVLKDNQVSQIPVLDKNGIIVGLIGKKNILNLMINDIDFVKEILEKKLEDIPYDEVITVHPISDIRRVAKVMIDLKLNAIPVVNEFNTLVGIVSKTDIIEAVSHIPNFKLWG